MPEIAIFTDFHWIFSLNFLVFSHQNLLITMPTIKYNSFVNKSDFCLLKIIFQRITGLNCHTSLFFMNFCSYVRSLFHSFVCSFVRFCRIISINVYIFSILSKFHHQVGPNSIKLVYFHSSKECPFLRQSKKITCGRYGKERFVWVYKPF